VIFENATCEEDRELDAADEDLLDHLRENDRIDEANHMQPEDARILLAKAVANRRALAECAGPHAFAPARPPGEGRWTGTWKCRECGGEVDSLQRVFYDQGLQHGRKRPARH